MSLPGARMLFEQRGPKLPYDAEVEYLESTGTQWIDTGYFPDGTTFGYKIEVLFLNNLIGTRSIAGCWGPTVYNNTGYCFSMGGNYNSRHGNSTNNWRGLGGLPSRIRVGERATVSIKNIGYSQRDGAYLMEVKSPLVNDVLLFSNPYLLKPNNSFVLCGIKTGGLGVVSEIPHCFLYAVTLYEGNRAVMDFIPVRFTNEQGVSEGAMYDRVSGELFRNQGTGAFGFGTDIAGGGVNG